MGDPINCHNPAIPLLGGRGSRDVGDVLLKWVQGRVVTVEGGSPVRHVMIPGGKR